MLAQLMEIIIRLIYHTQILVRTMDLIGDGDIIQMKTHCIGGHKNIWKWEKKKKMMY